MELAEGLKTRRSVRRFTDELVDHALFEEIIDLAKTAPSWKNTQTVRYVLVQNEDVIKNICENCVLGFEYNAKTLSKCKNLVILTQVNGRCGYEKDGSFSTGKGTGWEMFDAGVAAMSFSLAAYEKGIGSCIMGVFDDAKVAQAIGLEEGKSVVAVIPIGVPKFAPDPTPRKETADLVSYIE